MTLTDTTATKPSAQPTAHEPSCEQSRTDTVREQEFRWYGASMLIGLFAGALFDQVALPSVAAGVEATGRVRNTPWARATRSAASDQLVLWGDAADRQAEFDRLKDLHRAVKGTGYNGVRYSALNPESWNWILISTLRMHINAYPHITGKALTPEDAQAFWSYYCTEFNHLQLPGSSRLPESYAEVCDYYDMVVREKAQPNKTLDGAVQAARQPAFPEFLPGPIRPLWPLLGPTAGHALCILGFGIMDPQLRDLASIRWTRRHQIEFHALTKVVQAAHRHLPKRLTYSPLAYNRWKHEQLTAKYRSIGLTSFAADAEPST
jgi:uncharacterized protein (DUF2236 family)